MIQCNLKAMLTERGMTQKKLSELTGIRPPVISMLCHGGIKQIPMAGLDSLCRILSCQPGDIFTYLPDEAPAEP